MENNSSSKRKMIRKYQKKKGKKPSKAILIELAEKYAGVVSDVAKHCNVDRSTVHRWMQKDLEFKQKMDAGNEVLVELAIKGLKHNLENNSERSVHYTLDRLARDRGFGQLIKVQDKSKFQDQFAELSDEELEQLAIETANKLKKG